MTVGYSEVAFSRIALAGKLFEVVIHKEYHLSTADPSIVGKENCVALNNTMFF